MSNVLIAYDNAVYDGVSWSTPSVTVPPSAGGVQVLANTNLSDRWYASSMPAVAVFSLTVNGPLALVALVNHSLTLANGSWQLRGSNNGFVSDAYDSGVIPAFPSGSTAASIAGLRPVMWHRLSTPTQCAQWRISLFDTTLSSAYVGRLACFRSVWQPSINMVAGASLQWEIGAQTVTAMNGAEYFTERDPARVARFNVTTPMSEMLASGFDLARVAAGSKREVLFVYDPSDTVHQLRRTIFGRMRGLGPLEDINVTAGKASFEVKELL